MIEASIVECDVCGLEFVDKIDHDSHYELEHAQDPLQDPIEIPGTENPVE